LYRKVTGVAESAAEIKPNFERQQSNNNKSYFMKKDQSIHYLLFAYIFFILVSCIQPVKTNGYLLSFYDTIKNEYGYKDQKGKMIIPQGKYKFCFTDTFKMYAIVLKPTVGFVAIDRQEKVLYKVFKFDNGPDYPSDGIFRIIENGKIGFADVATGKVIIEPQFDCAFPFEEGKAKVSLECKIQSSGEHTEWLSENWFYIDKTGKKIN